MMDTILTSDNFNVAAILHLVGLSRMENIQRSNRSELILLIHHIATAEAAIEQMNGNKRDVDQEKTSIIELFNLSASPFVYRTRITQDEIEKHYNDTPVAPIIQYNKDIIENGFMKLVETYQQRKRENEKNNKNNKRREQQHPFGWISSNPLLSLPTSSKAMISRVKKHFHRQDTR
jgi:hypothetical protein